MVKTQTKLFGLAAVASVLLAASCGDDANPAAPSAAPGAIGAVGQTAGEAPALLAIDVDAALPDDDDVSLKTPPPPLSAPANDSTVENLTPTLRINDSLPRHVAPGAAPFTYEFEVYHVVGAAMTRVVHAKGVPDGGASTSYTIPDDLEQTSTYMWRARAEIGDEKGPWATPWTFLTPTLVSIGAPPLLAPANGAEVSTNRPDLVVGSPEIIGNPGAIQIDFQIDDDPLLPNPSQFSVALDPSGQTSGQFPDPLALNTTFGWRARATNGTIFSDWSPISTFSTTGSAEGPRTPDPPPGGKLPLPNEQALVEQIAAQHPEALANSCQEHGGTWDFMDLLIEALRAKDTRWGFNCKRGICPDISLDVVNYHWGPGPSQGSSDVYIIDTIGGHCGDNPVPFWLDQTDATADAGSIGVWIFPRP